MGFNVAVIVGSAGETDTITMASPIKRVLAPKVTVLTVTVLLTLAAAPDGTFVDAGAITSGTKPLALAKRGEATIKTAIKVATIRSVRKRIFMGLGVLIKASGSEGATHLN